MPDPNRQETERPKSGDIKDDKKDATKTDDGDRGLNTRSQPLHEDAYRDLAKPPEKSAPSAEGKQSPSTLSVPELNANVEILKQAIPDKKSWPPPITFDDMGSLREAAIAHFDAKTFKNVFLNKNEAQRRQIDDALKASIGRTAEDVVREHLQGRDLKDMLSVLHRKDGDVAGQRADRIRVTMDDLKSATGEDKGLAESQLRSMVSKSNSAQVAELERKGAVEAIMQNPNVSQATKESIEILRKGSDKLTPEDRLKLADVALKDNNLLMFQETMGSMPKGTREQFMREGGAQKISDAFECKHDGGIEKVNKAGSTDVREYQLAMDYARNGKFDVVKQIAENTRTWWWNNNEGINSAVAGMTNDERNLYSMGKNIKDGKSVETTDSQKQEAQDFYQRLHSALEKTGRLEELEAKVLHIQTDKKDQPDIIDRLRKLGFDPTTGIESAQDPVKAIREIIKEYKDNPEFTTKLQNDESYRKTFEETAKSALELSGEGLAVNSGKQVYLDYLAELRANGRLSLNSGIQLDRNSFKHDFSSLAQHFASATPAEKAALDDPLQSAKMLRTFNNEQQDVLQKVARQGEVRDEDKLRAAKVSGAQDEFIEALKDVKEENMSSVKRAYATAYGKDLESEAYAMLAPDRQAEARNKLASGSLTEAERQDRASEQARDAMYGFGSAAAALFNNGRDQLTSSLVQSDAASSRASAAEIDASMTEQQRAEAVTTAAKAREALENVTKQHIADKAAVADTISMAGTVVVCGAIAVGTLGTGTPLLAVMAADAAIGGSINVATKQALLGRNSDTTSVAGDAVGGAVMGALSALGPAEIGAITRAGRAIADRSATAVMTSISGEVKTALGATGETTIRCGLKDAMQEAITSGAANVKAATLQDIARRAIAQSAGDSPSKKAYVDALVDSMTKELNEQFKQGSGLVASSLRQVKAQASYTGGAGAAGGALQGGIESAMAGKDAGEIMEHATRGAVVGGLVAGAMGMSLLTASKIGSLRSAEHAKGNFEAPSVRPIHSDATASGDKAVSRLDSIADQAKFAEEFKKTLSDIQAGKSVDIHVTEDQAKMLYAEMAKAEPRRALGFAKGGEPFKVVNPDHPVTVSTTENTMTVTRSASIHDANGAKQTLPTDTLFMNGALRDGSSIRSADSNVDLYAKTPVRLTADHRITLPDGTTQKLPKDTTLWSGDKVALDASPTVGKDGKVISADGSALYAKTPQGEFVKLSPEVQLNASSVENSRFVQLTKEGSGDFKVPSELSVKGGDEMGEGTKLPHVLVRKGWGSDAKAEGANPANVLDCYGNTDKSLHANNTGLGDGRWAPKAGAMRDHFDLWENANIITHMNDGSEQVTRGAVGFFMPSGYQNHEKNLLMNYQGVPKDEHGNLNVGSAEALVKLAKENGYTPPREVVEALNGHYSEQRARLTANLKQEHQRSDGYAGTVPRSDGGHIALNENGVVQGWSTARGDEVILAPRAAHNSPAEVKSVTINGITYEKLDDKHLRVLGSWGHSEMEGWVVPNEYSGEFTIHQKNAQGNFVSTTYKPDGRSEVVEGPYRRVRNENGEITQIYKSGKLVSWPPESTTSASNRIPTRHEVEEAITKGINQPSISIGAMNLKVSRGDTVESLRARYLQAESDRQSLMSLHENALLETKSKEYPALVAQRWDKIMSSPSDGVYRVPANTDLTTVLNTAQNVAYATGKDVKLKFAGTGDVPPLVLKPAEPMPSIESMRREFATAAMAKYTAAYPEVAKAIDDARKAAQKKTVPLTLVEVPMNSPAI